MLENDSIAHHTSRYDVFAKILKGESFLVQYCAEKIYVNKHKNIHIAVPMVSFADIRPTDYVRAFWRPKKKGEKRIYGYYGDYAIGLSKDWAIRKNVIPILYIPKPKDSGEALATNNPIYELRSKATKSVPSRSKGKEIRALPHIACFCKHYTGALEKEEENSQEVNKFDYSFHLEQEWRYVSPTIPVRWNFYNSRSDVNFDDEKAEKKMRNREIEETLSFDLWEDVTYIVVKSNNSLAKTLALLRFKYIQKKRRLELLGEDTDHLLQRYNYIKSCIVTTEQLKNNL